MSTTIYIIRHGDIDFKERIPGRLSGHHLSFTGREQAEWIAEYLREIKIDAIYSSPLERAVETVELLAKDHKLEIKTEQLLTEIDFGVWTGRRFDEMESEFGWIQLHFYRNGCFIPNGELMIQVQKRMIIAMEEICHKHRNATVVLVSHNDPIKSLLAFFLGVSLDLFLRIVINTGSISELSICEECFCIKKLNITEKIAI